MRTLSLLRPAFRPFLHLKPTVATRPFSQSAAMAADPKHGGRSNEEHLAVKVEKLLRRGWALTADGQGIERSFKFKTFAKTWDFMTAVALESKLQAHHPEWSNAYNTVFIRWTTHSPPGLSHKDAALAALCNKWGLYLGGVQEELSEEQNCQHKGLVDHVAPTSGDSSVPPKESGWGRSLRNLVLGQ